MRGTAARLVQGERGKRAGHHRDGRGGAGLPTKLTVTVPVPVGVMDGSTALIWLAQREIEKSRNRGGAHRNIDCGASESGRWDRGSKWLPRLGPAHYRRLQKTSPAQWRNSAAATDCKLAALLICVMVGCAYPTAANNPKANTIARWFSRVFPFPKVRVYHQLTPRGCLRWGRRGRPLHTGTTSHRTTH